MMCKRDFRSLPALNGHMRSHSGVRSACASKVSAPHQYTQGVKCCPLWRFVVQQVTRHCRLFFWGGFFSSQNEDPSVSPSASMVMPVSVPVHSKGRAHKKGNCVFPASRKAALYQSLLREGASTGDGVSARHYTPPPMLCPVRTAPGLFCSLVSRRLKRVQTIQLHNTPGTRE